MNIKDKVKELIAADDKARTELAKTMAEAKAYIKLGGVK